MGEFFNHEDALRWVAEGPENLSKELASRLEWPLYQAEWFAEQHHQLKAVSSHLFVPASTYQVGGVLVALNLIALKKVQENHLPSFGVELITDRDGTLLVKETSLHLLGHLKELEELSEELPESYGELLMLLLSPAPEELKGVKITS